jgi:hypothetical protein
MAALVDRVDDVDNVDWKIGWALHGMSGFILKKIKALLQKD